MELGNIFKMRNVAYRGHTCDFLATARIELGEHDGDSLGSIIFFHGNEEKEITFEELNDLYGFPAGDKIEARLSQRQANAVWNTIASGQFRSGESKASLIRNPAIHYAQKMLSQTFSPRAETGNMQREELALHTQGIRDLIVAYSDGTYPEGILEELCLAVVFAQSLVNYGEVVRRTTMPNLTVSIDGDITPILLHYEVFCGDIEEPMLSIDAGYFFDSKILMVYIEDKFIHRFRKSAIRGLERKVLLPNRDITTVDYPGNVSFMPGSKWNFNAAAHPLVYTPSTCLSATRAGSSRDTDTYGSERYYFEAYDRPIFSKACRHSHKNIRFLQRWNKWQDKTIHKLVDRRKSMKLEIKSLKAKFGGSSSHTEEED